MRSRKFSNALLLAGALSLAVPATALAQDATVALPAVKGSKKSGKKKLKRGVVAGLATKGILVVYGGELTGAAKSAGANPGSVEGARAADAQFLLTVSIRRSRRKYFATATLVSATTGEQIKTIKKRYRKASSATKVGRAIGAAMAAEIMSAGASRPSAPVAAADPIDDEPPVAPKKKRKKRKAKIKDDDATSVSADVGGDGDVGGGEDKLLRLSLGAGTQALSAYTVAVGGQVTGLAYTLSPLMMINAGATVNIPDVNVGAELDLAFVPVKYAIDVQPAVSPNEPAGRFFNFGVNGFYKAELARFGEGGRFHLMPLLGLQYSSMTAESQGENSVVVSWSAIDIGAGARANVQVNEQLALSAFVRGGLVVSYSEGPTTTGDGGGGINLGLGADLRYWLSDAFGIFVRTAYTYQRIGLDGVGTRTPFVDDPPLESATVFNGDLKLGTGVLLAI